MDTPPQGGGGGWRVTAPAREPAQDKERKANPVFQTGLGLVHRSCQGRADGAWDLPGALPACSPSHLPTRSSGTFQRLFMRYFLSKIWDLRRRLQRLAFSARLLSQGWARHWAAFIRALWEGAMC